MSEANGQRILIDYNNMMEAALAGGFSEGDIAAIEGKISAASDALKRKRPDMAWRDLPYNQDEVVGGILNYVDGVKSRFDAFVVLGIGGSALGPMAVQLSINHAYYNELSHERRRGFPRFYVIDNVDPERLVALFDIIDIKHTLFNVVSKSGSTSETMSQFMIIKKMLEEKLGESASDNIVVTTDAEKGNLVQIAAAEGYKTFIVPDGVGGRFSQLCPVGLLPAAMTGVDIKKLLEGAAFMDKIIESEPPRRNPAYMFAILHYLGMKAGKNITVMMPYADSLKLIADWFAQLWAESLGKALDNSGNLVNVGQTPVKSLGATDQHSQVQLYIEGPSDKIVVFIGVGEFRETITIPEIYADIPSLGFLGGHTHNTLINTERVATEYALLKAGKMNMTISLPAVNEHTIGQLIYMFEVATAFAGELLDINAFDQPGVEDGKNATYALFGRPGYEEVRSELDARPEKESKYIV